MQKNHTFFIFLFLFLFLIDRITKILFFNKSGCFFIFCLISEKNKGGMLGIFQNFPLLIIFISLIILFFFIYFYIKEKNFYFRLSVIFIVTGIISNLFDRIFYGYVIDWISFNFKFYSFNIADCYLWIGLIFYLVSFLKKEK